MSDSLGENSPVMTRSPEGPSAAGDGARRAPSPAGRPRRGGTDWRKRFEVALLTGPAIIIFVTFVILPVGMAAYYGFYKWKGYGPPTDFIGLQNYVTIFKDSSFHEALQHNGMIVVLSLIIQGPVAVVMALLINQKMRGRSLLRVLIFVPYVISEVIVGTGWSLMLQTSGADNAVLTKIGLPGWTAELLCGPHVSLWTLTIIGSLQVFDLVYIIWGQYVSSTAGTSTMATYMVLNGRNAANYGFGNAVAVVLFLISLVIALTYQRFVLRRDTEGALTEGKK